MSSSWALANIVTTLPRTEEAEQLLSELIRIEDCRDVNHKFGVKTDEGGTFLTGASRNRQTGVSSG